MTGLILGALAVGLTLGLLGSGGSILTVPILVYGLGHGDKVSIAESLAIVGAIALSAMVPYARQRQIDWRSVLLFGLPGTAGTYLGAWLSEFVSGAVQLLLFAAVMLIAAVMMFRKASGSNAEPLTTTNSETHARQAAWKIVCEGLLVGVLTGLVGVGGGFLIVPALVLLGGLPMRLAVGTSLVVITMKSAAGFVKYLGVLEGLGQSVDWRTIGVFAVVGAVGSVVGNRISSHVPQARLKQGFAMFLVAMGLFVIYREAPKALASPATTESHAGSNEVSTEVTSQPPVFTAELLREGINR